MAFEHLSSDCRALIIGASGGIGSALTMAIGNVCGIGNLVTLSRSADGLDITDEDNVKAAAADIDGPFDLIFLATGALEIEGIGPEKSLAAITPQAMRAQFDLNALGPALVLKHFYPMLAADRRSVFAILTARVGSIGDNGLGGWISYRTAKAAAHQIIRTSSIEIARRRPEAICVALHPGTVQTDLTQKYAKGHTTVQPETAAQNLLQVIDGLTPEQTGEFFDWRGDTVEW